MESGREGGREREREEERERGSKEDAFPHPDTDSFPSSSSSLYPPLSSSLSPPPVLSSIEMLWDAGSKTEIKAKRSSFEQGLPQGAVREQFTYRKG